MGWSRCSLAAATGTAPEAATQTRSAGLVSIANRLLLVPPPVGMKAGEDLAPSACPRDAKTGTHARGDSAITCPSSESNKCWRSMRTSTAGIGTTRIAPSGRYLGTAGHGHIADGMRLVPTVHTTAHFHALRMQAAGASVEGVFDPLADGVSPGCRCSAGRPRARRGRYCQPARRPLRARQSRSATRTAGRKGGGRARWRPAPGSARPAVRHARRGRGPTR